MITPDYKLQLQAWNPPVRFCAFARSDEEIRSGSGQIYAGVNGFKFNFT